MTDLPQPALADDGEGLAGIDVEGQALDGAHHAVRRAEMGLQVLDLQEGSCPILRAKRPSTIKAASPGADRARRAARRRAGSPPAR